jgi:hypothetical protein
MACINSERGELVGPESVRSTTAIADNLNKTNTECGIKSIAPRMYNDRMHPRAWYRRNNRLGSMHRQSFPANTVPNHWLCLRHSRVEVVAEAPLTARDAPVLTEDGIDERLNNCDW